MPSGMRITLEWSMNNSNATDTAFVLRALGNAWI